MRPIQYIQRFESEKDLIEYMAEISNLMVGKDQRLKPIELQCFCVLVMAHNKFGNIASKSARDWALGELAKVKGGFTANSLVRYRARLYRKGFLVKDNQQYKVAPVFDFSVVPLKLDRVFVFAAQYKEPKE